MKKSRCKRGLSKRVRGESSNMELIKLSCLVVAVLLLAVAPAIATAEEVQTLFEEASAAPVAEATATAVATRNVRANAVAATVREEAREQVREVRAEAREQVQQVREEAREKIKERLTAVRQRVKVVREARVERIAQKLDARVENSANQLEKIGLRLEARGVNVSGITVLLERLRDAQTNLDNSTNVSQLQDALREIKQAYDQSRERIRIRLEERAANQVRGAVNRANGLITRVDDIVSKLKENGVNTSDVEQKVAQIRTALSQANEASGTNVREATHLLVQTKRMLWELKFHLNNGVRNANGLASLPLPRMPPEETPTVTPEATVTPEPSP